MIRKVQIEALECRCNLPDCPSKGEPWFSLGKRPPIACSTCKSREWNGVKKRRKPAPKIVIDLPKPVRVRSLEDAER